jgi:hypothetical protein
MVGVHLRGYHRFTGLYGVDTEWNVIPVHHTVNCTYKQVTVTHANGTTSTRNIGYQTLTAGERDE